MAQLAGALGQPREHRVAVRDGFVAGRFDAAGNSFSWMYAFFFHPQILPRWLLESLHGDWTSSQARPSAASLSSIFGHEALNKNGPEILVRAVPYNGMS